MPGPLFYSTASTSQKTERLRVVLNKRRVVPLRRRGHAHCPQAAARNGGDGRESAVRSLAEGRARDEGPDAVLALEYERVVVARGRIDVPTDRPCGAISRGLRSEQVVLTGTGVRGCLDG